MLREVRAGAWVGAAYEVVLIAKHPRKLMRSASIEDA